jgi:hypothetical protein
MKITQVRKRDPTDRIGGARFSSIRFRGQRHLPRLSRDIPGSSEMAPDR